MSEDGFNPYFISPQKRSVFGGPFGDNGQWIGIFIFDCASKEEAKTLLKTDPAVKNGRLNYEIHPWWTGAVGSKGELRVKSE